MSIITQEMVVKIKDLLDFKDIRQTWGTEVEIQEGKYKGYRLETKTIIERVYEIDGVDDVGLPRFNVSHHTVIRVLPPKIEK